MVNGYITHKPATKQCRRQAIGECLRARTYAHTDGQPENIMPPAPSIGRGRHNKRNTLNYIATTVRFHSLAAIMHVGEWFG